MMSATGWAPPTGPMTVVLNKLGSGIRRSGSGWMARCPAHEDRQASLSVTEGGDGRALVYCHAGCDVEAVTAALGLGTADLFAPRVSPITPARRSRGRDVSERPKLYVVRTPEGEPVAVHERVDTSTGKRVTWRLPDGTAGLNGTPTAELPLFGSENLPSWDASRPVLLAEGEPATLAMLHAGFRALGTVTGASSAPSVRVLQSLRGHHVILWPDNDDAGRKHMHRIADRLEGIAASLRLLTWPDAPEHGDAADLLAGGSAAEVDALIAAAVPLTAPGPVLVRLEAVQREPLALIWDGRVYRRKVHLFEGDPGLGKTTMALDLGARITRGAVMPDGTPGIPAAGLVILSAEDGLADTIRPRLEAAGADLSRVVALAAMVDADGERLPSLPRDLAAVEAAVREVDAAMVIVDPLMAYLDATVNSWRDQDVRRALAPLARMAERTDAAVVAIRHLNKSSGSHAMYRGGGSIGIVGAARVALLVAADPDDAERRVLATIKNNLAPHPASLAFRLVSDEVVGAARVEWLGESEHGASALLAIPAGEDERGALEEACEVLHKVLADGPLPARDAMREARDAGLSEATIRRAMKAAGVRSERVGGLGSAGRWEWRLSPKALTETLRHSSPESEHLSRLSEWNGAIRHTCAACQRPAEDAELTIAEGRYLHRDGCQVPA